MSNKTVVFGVLVWALCAAHFSVVGQNTNKSGTHDREKEKLASITEDGTVLAQTTYDSKNGDRVFIANGKFLSAEAAQREARTRLKAAIKVIEQSPKKGSDGNVVGTRFLALFSDPNNRQNSYRLLWTNGREFYCLSSSSLAAVLEAEESIRVKHVNENH